MTMAPCSLRPRTFRNSLPLELTEKTRSHGRLTRVEEAIAARIHDGRDIPPPSHGREVAVLPTLTAVKVMLYQGMREQGIGKAELARRLGWHLPQVDRILDVQHKSRMDQVDAAMGAIGRHLHVRASAQR